MSEDASIDEVVAELDRALDAPDIPSWLVLVLRVVVVFMRRMNAQLRESLERVARQDAELAKLRKQVYGRKSEKRARTTKAAGGDAGGTHKRKKHGARNPGPSALDEADLPEEHVTHALPADERVCPVCGERSFRELPGAEDSTEFVYVPARVIRRVHHRKKYACANGCSVVTAPGPARVVDGGRFHASFYAQVVTQRSTDAIPFHRQAEILRRAEVPISTSTLCDLFHDAARRLEPLYKLLIEKVRGSPLVHADETPQPVLDVGKTRRAYVWTFATQTTAVFVHAHGRSGETPKKILGNTSGKLMVDGYSGYNVVEAPDVRTRAACLAHARRKFVEAQSQNPRKVAWLLKRVGEIYAIEDEAEARGVRGTAEHLALRQSRTQPIMEEIHAWLQTQKGRARPKSPFGKAVSYMDNQWSRLEVFLTDAAVPPDNNHAERLLRRIALGRKNSLFVAHDPSGERYAINMSIVATCRLNDVNPVDYLTDVLPKILSTKRSELPSLLPHHWQPE